ncbi:MAG: nicotinate-nucleotide adenylyltransferase [Firmicutes bacterium]|nr:nicotinate-nucleotide adenylyltransferase [Bacillota bacterium]
MGQIGILGGSFDPFHYGHLSIAKAALKECGLSKVVLMPTKVQPFKLGKKRASEEDRVNMVRLIAKKNENFAVSTIEAFSQDVSYTYKTLQALSEEYGREKLHFILGTDSFLSIETWYRGEDLLREYSFIVGVRPGYKENETEEKMRYFQEKYGTKVKILHNRVLEVSSTEIKERIRNKESIRQFVPYEIERYIDEHGLYQDLY